MGRLIYSAITSLDGYVSDEDGRFDWAAPDGEVHAFVNDLERGTGTYLYGRRMYETMTYWETVSEEPDGSEESQGSEESGEPPVAREFARLWKAAEKVVYSTTLAAVSTARTRLERTFDPATITAMKRSAGADIGVGGAGLAAQALAAGLVDECHLFLNPVLVGGGTRALPDGVRLRLELLDHHRFAGGVVHLHYRSRT